MGFIIFSSVLLLSGDVFVFCVCGFSDQWEPEKLQTDELRH